MSMKTTGVALLMAVSFAGCGGRVVPLQGTTSSVIAGVYHPMEVRTALIRALEAQRFRVDSENGTQLTATYSQRRRTIVVRIAYTPSSYEVTYLNSAGLMARTDAGGHTWINRRYQRHIDGLNRRIRNEFEHAAEHAHERELAMVRAQRPVVVQPTVVAVAPTVAPGAYVTGSVTAGGYVTAPPVQAPAPAAYGPSCEDALADQGHSRSTEMFCDGAEPYCARELIYQGHAPSALIFCQGVDPRCAVDHLRGGGAASALIHCH